MVRKTKDDLVAEAHGEKYVLHFQSSYFSSRLLFVVVVASVSMLSSVTLGVITRFLNLCNVNELAVNALRWVGCIDEPIIRRRPAWWQ